MKFLLISLFSISLFAQNHVEVGMAKYLGKAFYAEASGGDNGMPRYNSAVTLKHAVSVLTMSRVLREAMGDDQELYELRDDDAVRYIKSEENRFLRPFQKIVRDNHKWVALLYSRYDNINESLMHKLYTRMNENFEEHFVRYLRVLKREIPWDRIQHMEKGLSLGEALDAVDAFTAHEPVLEHLVKRYELKMTWRDMAREVIAFYFKQKLYKEQE